MRLLRCRMPILQYLGASRRAVAGETRISVCSAARAGGRDETGDPRRGDDWRRTGSGLFGATSLVGLAVVGREPRPRGHTPAGVRLLLDCGREALFASRS